MTTREYNHNFYDDASSVQDPSDNRGYGADHPVKPQITSIFSGYSYKKSMRETQGTLGGLLGNYQRDTISTQKSIGTVGGFIGNYGVDTIEEESVYDDSQFNNAEPAIAGSVEQQIANLSYVEVAEPLYDPNNMIEPTLPASASMIIPMMIDHNTSAPTNNKKNINMAHVGNTQHSSNKYGAPYGQSVDLKREQRIKELKTEINSLDRKVAKNEEKEKKSRGCCYCCPTSRKGKFILFIVITLIIGALGLLLYFFWPKVPQFKVKKLGVIQGLSPVINVTEDQSSFRVSYTLNLTVEVINNNRYGIKTDLITMKVYISPNMQELGKTNYPGSALTGSVDDHLVGEARTESINFPAQSNRTFYSKLEIDFYPDPQLGILGDPAVGEIIRVCHPEAIKRKELIKIIYQVEVKIGIFSKFGFTPKILDEISVGCPLGDKNADTLFSQEIFSPFVNNSKNETESK